MNLLLPLLVGASTPALADEVPDNYEFSLEGFYRVRYHAFGDLYADTDEAEIPNARYMTHKLRFQPQLNFQDRAKFTFMTDVFDNTVWGDNEDLASTALFANNPSDTGVDGMPADLFQVRRAWMEFKVPIGVLQVGRVQSHWGMGLLANHGNGFDDTFGENKYGNSFDRVIFLTNPVSIAQAILKKDGPEVPLFAAFGVDRLVEDPLTQYYGYECDPDDPDDSEFCAQDDDHGFTEERDPSQRNDTWLSQHGDDVVEFLYVLIYRGEDLDWGRSAADLTVGGYAINRVQLETNSDVWIYDAYVKMRYLGLLVEAEGVTIQGTTEAIALPGSINYDPAAGQGPLYKEANIFGGVARLGYEKPSYTIMMEAGMASGDDNVADAEFTGRPLHADFNVGLLLYEEIIERVTRYTWTDAADGLWSNGGVYNSKYIFPNLRYRPLDNWEAIGAFLVAWPHKPDGAIILTDEDASDNILGWEVDAAIKHRWHEHLNFTLEYGLAQVSDRLPVDDLGLTNDGRVWTFQSRMAYEF
jgi:hypothetical protein